MAEECDVDEFLLFYIKSRIEWDGKYEWFDSPFIRDLSICERCSVIADAALIFAERRIFEIKDSLVFFVKRNCLNYPTYKRILDQYLSLLKSRSNLNEGGNSLSTCTELLSIIAFAGIFARILSEFDHSGDFADRKVVEDIEDNFIQIRCRRDFRKEIYQLSIYASKALQGRIVGDYDWQQFSDDAVRWKRQLLLLDNQSHSRILHSFHWIRSHPLLSAVALSATAVLKPNCSSRD